MLQGMHAARTSRSSVQETESASRFNIYATEPPIVKMDTTKIRDYAQLVKIFLSLDRFYHCSYCSNSIFLYPFFFCFFLQ